MIPGKWDYKFVLSAYKEKSVEISLIKYKQWHRCYDFKSQYVDKMSILCNQIKIRFLKIFLFYI